MAWAAFICNIESEYVSMIAFEQDPKLMWDTLADANKSKCTAYIYTLRNRLMNSKMTQGMSNRSFANEICSIERQLAFGGKLVAEDDEKYAFLNGLRSEYQVKDHPSRKSW